MSMTKAALWLVLPTRRGIPHEIPSSRRNEAFFMLVDVLPKSVLHRFSDATKRVRSTPERVVPVRALAGDIVLRSLTRHFTLTVPLSTQVKKWVPVNCWGIPIKFPGSDRCDGLASLPGGVEIPLVASCCRNRVSGSYKPLGSKWSLTKLEVEMAGRYWRYWPNSVLRDE